MPSTVFEVRVGNILSRTTWTFNIRMILFAGGIPTTNTIWLCLILDSGTMTGWATVHGTTISCSQRDILGRILEMIINKIMLRMIGRM